MPRLTLSPVNIAALYHPPPSSHGARPTLPSHAASPCQGTLDLTPPKNTRTPPLHHASTHTISPSALNNSSELPKHHVCRAPRAQHTRRPPKRIVIIRIPPCRIRLRRVALTHDEVCDLLLVLELRVDDDVNVLGDLCGRAQGKVGEARESGVVCCACLYAFMLAVCCSPP